MGQHPGIDRFLSFGRIEEVTCTVAVDRTEQSLPFDHVSQRGKQRSRRFLFYQLGVVDLVGGIVENHQQVIPAIILEPLMVTPDNVEQHPRQRTTGALASVNPSVSRFGHQSRRLKRSLYPRVTQANSMLA